MLHLVKRFGWLIALFWAVTANAGYFPPGAYALGYGFPGKPPASGNTGNYAILTPEFTVTFPANFGSSLNRSSTCHVGTNPTSSATFTITDNGSTIGTIVISTLGAVTFATTGGTAKTVTAGHEVRITAPASQDSTLADVSCTLAGSRAGL